MPVKPQLLAWITCDGVHLDPVSGKYYILGVFSSIRARQFPVVHPRMFWFLILTEVSTGKHRLKISLNLPTDPPKVVAAQEFASRSPLDRIHIIHEIQHLRFESEGGYALMIEVDDDPILVTTFHVSH